MFPVNETPQAEATGEIDPENQLPLEWDDDDVLIRWMLGLTPSERLAVGDGMLQLAEVARRGRRP
mgnify:CR=1 FL=1